MKDMEWTKFINSKGEEEEFRIIERDIQFSKNTRFLMGSKDFIVCCVNVEKVPVTHNTARKEIHVGEDHKCQVFISRTATSEEQDEVEQIVQITLKKDPNWNSSIEFTIGELINILQEITKEQGDEMFKEFEDTTKKDEEGNKGDLKTSIETLSKMTELLSQLIVNLENI